MNTQQIFRASEILEMAIQMERRGLAFYKACAEASVQAALQDVFQFMIDQELKHVEIFANMKKRLAEDYRLPESYPGETGSYLNSFLEDQVFLSPEQAADKVREISNPLQAVDLAVRFEKGSILFYSGIKQMVRSSEHDQVERVIVEEHRHIRRLLELRRRFAEDE